MTNEKLTELLKIAYRWGRDNGSNRSEKNFNDLLQTEAIYEALRIHDVLGRSEQLVCDCGNKLTDKEMYFGQCLQCDKNVEEARFNEL